MQQKPKRMRISIDGKLQKGVTPKDVALFIISKLSASGATGFFVEYAGKVFKDMSMEGRMTVCNLSIEMGARGGMIAPDEKTIEYIKDREFSPTGNAWKNLLNYWNSLYSDIDANFDKDISFDAILLILWLLLEQILEWVLVFLRKSQVLTINQTMKNHISAHSII